MDQEAQSRKRWGLSARRAIDVDSPVRLTAIRILARAPRRQRVIVIDPKNLDASNEVRSARFDDENANA